MDKLRILIVDDHALYRSGMTALLKSVPGMQVVGAAVDGNEAITLATNLQPDVILMDLHMPGISGIEATRRILHTSPHIRILIVTMFEDEHSIFMALRAGASGYTLKDADENDLLQAIRAIANDEVILTPSIARRLLDFFSSPPSSPSPQTFPGLTEQEHQVLDLLAQGHTQSDIVQHLALHQKTVANLISSMLSKLQISDRAQGIVRTRKGT